MSVIRMSRFSVFILLIATIVAVSYSGGCNGSNTDGCLDNADCEATEYCEKAVGNCGGTGECLPVPGLCPDVWSPVCGCDDTTYGNDCNAAAAGVNIAFEGWCPPTCTSDDDCLVNEYCDKSEGGCEGEGICVIIINPCPMVYNPVCGCDGVTYVNECEALRAGIDVDSPGECPPPPCTDNSDCEAAEYCQKAIGDCGGVGGCLPVPEYCNMLYDPVCGCNDVTYGNSCEAAAMGVSAASVGVCPAP